MKTNVLRNVSFVISLLLYNYFFWNESLGINLFLFTLLLILYLFNKHRSSFSVRNVRITLAGTIITAIAVVINNSLEAKFAHIFSFFLMVAFIHESKIRSVAYATLHILSSFVIVPLQFIEKNMNASKKIPALYFFIRFIRLSIFPLMIAFVFYVIYSLANPIFSEYSDSLFSGIINAISDFLKNFDLAHVFFITAGIFVLAVIYFRNESAIFLVRDMSMSDKLERKRESRRHRFMNDALELFPSYKMTALKNQRNRGMILFLLVNILLLFENVIDIKWLWFGFELPEGFSLQHYVREGAGLLIVSIFLSMALLLHYFRRNQNFYPKNRLLKILAYAWIFQNVVLCISVLLRNYHYIDFHGLAYKRIGVYVFLALTAFGLYTFYIKIKNIRSAYFLVRVNSLAVYFILVALSCFNWDVNIASYNLAHPNKGEIDVDFYLELSGKSLPVIFNNLEKVNEQIEAHKHNEVRWIRSLDYDKFVNELNKKRERFIKNCEVHTWLSFNVRDWNAYQLLTGGAIPENRR